MDKLPDHTSSYKKTTTLNLPPPVVNYPFTHCLNNKCSKSESWTHEMRIAPQYTLPTSHPNDEIRNNESIDEIDMRERAQT